MRPISFLKKELMPKQASKNSTSGIDHVIGRLLAIAENLTWTWHEPAQRPFAMLDPIAWEATNHAPIETMLQTSRARIQAVAGDERFLQLLTKAERVLARAEMQPKWFQKNHRGRNRKLKVAYYCSEFAIHESMQQYSGGLGVLAGDHLKSAEDLGVPMIGVGLLYQHGYYRQQFEQDGRQRVIYPQYDFDCYPIEETGIMVACPIGNRNVFARVMCMHVGSTPILLLDANLPENRKEDQNLTEGLYKGDADLRMRQQVLLGVGGAMAIEAADLGVTVHHLNEGHAAFAAMERVARLVEQGHDLTDAMNTVKESTVFTTHTPVPAGHDRYDPTAVRKAMGSVLRRAGIAPSTFVDFGRERPGDKQESFCMTVLALRFANRVNGVAKLHGEVSRDMWVGAFPELDQPKDVPIGSVTNGVHPGTWMDPAAQAFWSKHIKLDQSMPTPEQPQWKKAAKVDATKAWGLRNQLRARLVRFVRERSVRQAVANGAAPHEVLAAGQVLQEDALTICFARRFATYKRAPLVFRDTRRLAAILNNSEQPVQLIFAGKAHPRDAEGQAFAQKIFKMSRRPEFMGKVVVLDEYDMRVGRELTAGADVWLNTPIRPHEASGTSGMKPPMHLGVNCSILDGWWPEGFDGKNGFAIVGTPSRSGAAARDQADAEALYAVLEDELIPEFFSRNRQGLPSRWMKRALRGAATVPGAFSTHRMVGDYVQQAYLPAHRAIPSK